LANAKSSFVDIQKNIEDRILRDTLAHRPKIESNYPSTDITIAAIRTVLDWPNNRTEITTLLDGIIQKATAVDGLSGEKGLFGYSAIAPRTLADLLGRYERMDPGFLAAALKRNPRLHAMYRFHLDTWCLGEYYPCTGDTGSFAGKVPHYAGLSLARHPGIGPSAFTFLWDLAAATGDQDFIRLLYAANGHTVAGLPYDLFSENPTVFQQQVERIIAREKADICLGSINKTQWCLAILRAGAGPQARAAWLDYDSGERHGHADALNLGLFAKGIDLMPDCGYPPVQYGGWGAPRAVWYTQSVAHNTVVVDGQNTRPGRGRWTLWADGRQFRAVRASAANLIGGKQYERTAALVDLSDKDSYLVDIFRVAGGREHTKFLHSHFGSIQPQGLSLQPAEETRFGGLMRNFRKDSRPPSSWSVDWKIQDYLKYLPRGKEIHLRCTDLTPAHEVLTAEAWVAVGQYGGTAEAWIPRVLVRRKSAQAPLASTFVSVLEPYEGQAGIKEIRRLRLEGAAFPEADVALDIRLANGCRDVFIAADAENPLGQYRPVGVSLIQKETGIRLDGQLAWVRFDPAGKVQRLVLCQGQSLEVGSWRLKCKSPAGLVEIDLEKPLAPMVSGATEEIENLSDGQKKIWPR
jgi:hypothetical protein